MAAPKGNQYWKFADPECLGRPRNYPKPNDLWEAVKPYFMYCDANPIIKTETTTTDKGSMVKEIQYKIPYTWEGLYVFLGICDLERYKQKKEFAGIITHIGNTIRTQKLEGAAAGVFNANIIAKELGLIAKKETEHSGNIGITYIDED